MSWISGGRQRVVTAFVAFSMVGILFCNAARATLIAYEPFNYPVGDTFNTKTGGVGWTTAWVPFQNNAANAPAGSNTIVAGSLAGPAGLTTVGNSAVISATAGTAQFQRSFPNVAGTAGTSTWYSFLGQRLGSNAGGTNWPNNPFPRGANMGLFNTEGTPAERVAMGNATTMNNADATHFDEWSYLAEGALATREGPASHLPKWSELAWGVMRIDHVGDGTVADNVYMWLNPDPLGGEPLIANAAVTVLSGDANSRDASNIDFIRPFVGAVQNSGNAATQRPFAVMALDEIRIGTTWDDMRNTAGIPEPTSCVMLVLGALAAMYARRRQR